MTTDHPDQDLIDLAETKGFKIMRKQHLVAPDQWEWDGVWRLETPPGDSTGYDNLTDLTKAVETDLASYYEALEREADDEPPAEAVEREAEALDREAEALDRKAEALEREADDEPPAEAVERQAEALDREVEALDRKAEALEREADDEPPAT